MKPSKRFKFVRVALLLGTVSCMVCFGVSEVREYNAVTNGKAKATFERKYDETVLGCSVSDAESVIGLRDGSITIMWMTMNIYSGAIS